MANNTKITTIIQPPQLHNRNYIITNLTSVTSHTTLITTFIIQSQKYSQSYHSQPFHHPNIHSPGPWSQPFHTHLQSYLAFSTVTLSSRIHQISNPYIRSLLLDMTFQFAIIKPNNSPMLMNSYNMFAITISLLYYSTIKTILSSLPSKCGCHYGNWSVSVYL